MACSSGVHATLRPINSISASLHEAEQVGDVGLLVLEELLVNFERNIQNSLKTVVITEYKADFAIGQLNTLAAISVGSIGI